MGKRVVNVTFNLRGGGRIRRITFDLTCAQDARFEEMQKFEIVAPRGRESVIATPLRGQVINRSDGTTSVTMIPEERNTNVLLLLLRSLPNVSNIQTK